MCVYRRVLRAIGYQLHITSLRCAYFSKCATSNCMKNLSEIKNAKKFSFVFLCRGQVPHRMCVWDQISIIVRHYESLSGLFFFHYSFYVIFCSDGWKWSLKCAIHMLYDCFESRTEKCVPVNLFQCISMNSFLDFVCRCDIEYHSDLICIESVFLFSLYVYDCKFIGWANYRYYKQRTKRQSI